MLFVDIAARFTFRATLVRGEKMSGAANRWSESNCCKHNSCWQIGEANCMELDLVSAMLFYGTSYVKPRAQHRQTVIFEEFLESKTVVVHYKIFNYSIFSKW